MELDLQAADSLHQMFFVWDRPLYQLLSPDEIFERADDAMLRQKVFEDNRLELKPGGIHSKEIGKYLCMWANTAPSGGLIVIGVKHDKSFEGCSRLTADQLDVFEGTNPHCPDGKSVPRRIAIRNDRGEPDFVILLRVKYQPNKAVSTSDGKYYVRQGHSLHELKTPDEIRELQAEKGEVRFESEPSGLKYPKEFDTHLVGEFVAAVRLEKGWDQSHSIEDILDLMHLGRIKGQDFEPNVACALLFSKDPRSISPGCRIRFLRFEGETEGTGAKWNAVKDQFIDGTIPQQIEAADELLRSQLRTFSRLMPNGKFEMTAEYPPFAWHEAIVNACAHRSYGNGMKNMTIFVRMFDDRLVVESPGPFPAFVTPNNIYETHHPRNPFLMDALFFLKFTRCAHEGTKRIREEMRYMELPAPEFKQDDGQTGSAQVRVTLRNNVNQRKVWVDSDVMKVLAAQAAHKLTEHQKQCINFAAENEEISVSDAQRLTGKTWQAAKKLLVSMVADGIFEHRHRPPAVGKDNRDPAARFVFTRPIADRMKKPSPR